MFSEKPPKKECEGLHSRDNYHLYEGNIRVKFELLASNPINYILPLSLMNPYDYKAAVKMHAY